MCNGVRVGEGAPFFQCLCYWLLLLLEKWCVLCGDICPAQGPEGAERGPAAPHPTLVLPSSLEHPLASASWGVFTQGPDLLCVQFKACDFPQSPLNFTPPDGGV